MNTQRPSACFAGTRLEALQALERYTEVVAILTVPGSWVHSHCEAKGRRVQLVERHNREAAFRFLAEQTVWLVLSAGFPFILPPSVLASGPMFVNSHPSLLPAYPGEDSIRQAFARRESYMGVTIHFMTADVDQGPIICQERVWVEGFGLQELYDLQFSVVEPLAITRALEQLRHRLCECRARDRKADQSERTKT